MIKIERISLMIPGLPCTVLYNGKTKYYNVKVNANGKNYIQVNGMILHEDELPLGEEMKMV